MFTTKYRRSIAILGLGVALWTALSAGSAYGASLSGVAGSSTREPHVAVGGETFTGGIDIPHRTGGYLRIEGEIAVPDQCALRGGEYYSGCSVVLTWGSSMQQGQTRQITVELPVVDRYDRWRFLAPGTHYLKGYTTVDLQQASARNYTLAVVKGYGPYGT